MSATLATLAGAADPASLTVDGLNKKLAEHIAMQSSAFHAQLKAAQAARAKSAPAASAPRPPAIDGAQFTSYLTEMREHYISGAGAVAARMPQSGSATPATEHLYKLPEALVYHPASAVTAPVGAPRVQAQPSAAGDSAVDELLEHVHTGCLDVVRGSTQALVAAAQEAERTKLQTAAWTQQMNALRERDKAAARAKLDALYAKAAAIGQQHPNHRAQVLQITSHGSNLLNALYAGLAGVGFEVERGVKEAIQHALPPAAQAAQTVGKWAESAVQTISKTFSGLLAR